MTTDTDVIPEAIPEAAPRAPRETVDVMIGQILDKDVEEINAMLIEGKELEKLAADVAKTVVEERNDYEEKFPWFDWDTEEDEMLKSKIEAYFVSQIDQHIMYLREKEQVLEHKTERLAEIEKNPEKKALWKRALDKVKGFAIHHPILTAVGVLALAFAAAGVGFWLAGEWELFATSTGLNKVFAAFSGSESAVSQIENATVKTLKLPGEGVYGVPPGTSPPGAPPQIR